MLAAQGQDLEANPALPGELGAGPREQPAGQGTAPSVEVQASRDEQEIALQAVSFALRDRHVRLGLDSGGHVPNYMPDVVAMVCGAMVHEAHHRGQISHWCRELGVPITPEQSLMLWEWDKLHKRVNRDQS